MDNKNIFVVFSPGTGGNHLANMLATDPEYITRSSSADYFAHPDSDAHVGNLKNFSQSEDNFNTRPRFGNVFCFHFGVFYWMYSNIQKFENRQIILVQLPNDTSSLAYCRYKKFTGGIAKRKYFLNEQKTLYTPDVFQKLFGENDFFTIPAEIIFNDSIDSFFDYAKCEMNFNLDYNECSQMHNIWIQKIKDYVKQ